MKLLLASAGLPNEDLDNALGAACVVAIKAGEIVGSAAVETYGNAGLLRSVAVSERMRGAGVGEALTRDRLEWARERGLGALYLLTTTAAEYFPRFGFTPTARTAVPAPVLQASEFRSVCPSTATVMRLDLTGAGAPGFEGPNRGGKTTAANDYAMDGKQQTFGSRRETSGGRSPRLSDDSLLHESECDLAVRESDPDATLPVAVIGAGPIGLSAAVQLNAKGLTPIVFEAGNVIAASVRQWAHVRLFSPWKYLVDPVTRTELERRGWTMPDPEGLPTGGELVERLLEPVAALPMVAPQIRLNHRVLAITRVGYDKVRTAGRETAPFQLVVEDASGRVRRVLARAVIDASGTWRTPNPLGAGGLDAEGEAAAREHIVYGIPDATRRDRERYAGKRVLIVGSGHSAFNTLLDLARLKQEAPTTQIVWSVRRAAPGLMFGGGANDALPARGALGARLQKLVGRGVIDMHTGVRIARVEQTPEGIVAWTDTEKCLGPVDEIVVATGFRPDLLPTRELRLELDAALEAPAHLAPLIDPNQHSCGTVYPHGALELAHPEKDYYIVGMKSYGRAPTFLLLTGYEQVRSVACALVGDDAGARDVQLVLPETGVCQTDCIVESTDVQGASRQGRRGPSYDVPSCDAPSCDAPSCGAQPEATATGPQPCASGGGNENTPTGDLLEYDIVAASIRSDSEFDGTTPVCVCDSPTVQAPQPKPASACCQ